MNSELLTYTLAMRHRELRHEADQLRLLAHLPAQRNSPVRHTIALCGVMMVKVGMKLKQMEAYG